MLNSYILPYASYCNYDVGFLCKLPREIDPFTSCHWTIGTLYMVEFVDHIYIVYLYLPSLLPKQNVLC